MCGSGALFGIMSIGMGSFSFVWSILMHWLEYLLPEYLLVGVVFLLSLAFSTTGVS